MDTTSVIFRKDKDGVFALFPEIPADYYGNLCESYQHVGQHSGADYRGCIHNSKQATPKEFADLLKELRTVGYENLVVKHRASPEMHEKRRAAAKENC
jgi:hypothetical protein